MRIYIISGTEVRITARRPSKLGKSDVVVTSVDDLAASRLPTKRLVAIWNTLPATRKVTKAPDRAAMIERLWTALQALPARAEKGRDAKAGSTRATKQSAVIALLRRPEGATIEEIAAATSWQHHTVRGAIAGALKKKLGLPVAASKEERGRVYRIA